MEREFRGEMLGDKTENISAQKAISHFRLPWIKGKSLSADRQERFPQTPPSGVSFIRRTLDAMVKWRGWL